MTDILTGFTKSGIKRKIQKGERFLNAEGLPQLAESDWLVAEVVYPQYTEV